jgi:pyruvate/2-oxoglutarate dehydrogenase complex dihydrolipoamide dehydrogenase (E3) component
VDETTTPSRSDSGLEFEADLGMRPFDEHNRALVSNVHPPDWVNPQPSGRYNLVVLGAGTAGLVTAAGAAGLGAKVALIERHLMGGDCLNVGCVPSKALIRASRAAADVRDAGAFGVRVPEGVSIDFPAVMERMRRIRAGISPHDSAARFRELGIDVYLGQGRFTGRDSVEVGGQSLRFSKAVVATGARASEPPIPGLLEAGYLTNETVFSLTELPQRLAVIGAGPIGCELAQAFARFGSRVTLLEANPRILGREDRDAAAIVERSLRRDGVELICGTKIIGVRRAGDETVLELEGKDGRSELRCDDIMVGAGRAPNVEGMGLEAAGVDYDRSGVTVDDRLRTSNPKVFAAGDICSRYKFTHAADAMARIVIQNALFLGRAKASALTIPLCTYTDPEIAHVGLVEEEAREQGIPTRTFVQELAKVDRAILDGEIEGFVKVLARQSNDEILGATIVARHAGEMISELTLAMVGGVGLKGLSRVTHPYPTQAEAIRRVGDSYNRTRLTPLVKGLFERWLSWTR